MKKIVGPMDSTQEFDALVDEPSSEKVVKKKPVKQMSNKNKNQDPTKPKKKVNRTKDWSFWAILISLLIVLVPAGYMGITLYRAYSETGRPVIGHRFDNDLVPTIQSEDIKTLETSLGGLEGIQSAKVYLTTATVRVYVALPDDVAKDGYSVKGREAESILLDQFSVEDYFTAFDSQLQYDYEIYVHNSLTDEPVLFLLNKTSRMEEAQSQFLSDAVSQEAVDEIWRIQEELDNPVVEDALENTELSEEPAADE